MEKLELVKERSFGENISMSFDFIKANFANTKNLIIYLVIIAAVSGLVSLVPTLGTALSTIVSAIASLLVITYVASYMKSYVSTTDGKINEEEVKVGSKKYLLPIFLGSLLLGIGIMIGLVLLVVPGIFIAVSCSFYAFCIINDDLSIMDGLKRSYALVKNNWWVTFGYLIVVGLVLGVISFVFSLIGGIFMFIGSFGIAIGTFITYSVSFIVSIISSFAMGVYYYNLVDKSEGVHDASQIDSIGQDK